MRLARSPPPTSRSRGNEIGFESNHSLTDVEEAAPQTPQEQESVATAGVREKVGMIETESEEAVGGRAGKKNSRKVAAREDDKLVTPRGPAHSAYQGNGAMRDTSREGDEWEERVGPKNKNITNSDGGLEGASKPALDREIETAGLKKAHEINIDQSVRADQSKNPTLAIVAPAPEVKRLDSEVYKPWGSRSSNTSPAPESQMAEGDVDPDGDLSICKGGPGKRSCGNKVTESEEAVECEKCSRWFHCKCLSISKAALNALKKWHGTLMWLCSKCKETLKERDSITECLPKYSKIETQMDRLEQIVRLNGSALDECIRNQERMFAGQCNLTEKLLSVPPAGELQQKSYAEALKGVSAEVVEQVSKKIDKMPSVTMPVQRSNEELAGLLDEMQDKERRKLNVVVHNLREADGQSYAERSEGDTKTFKNMVKHGLKLIVETTKTFRVGKKDGNKPRLMVVTLTSMAHKVEILRSAASLRDTKWNNVYITPDLTWKEREKRRQLRDELARRKEAGEEHIWIRHGKIVQIPEEKRQLPNHKPQDPSRQRETPSDRENSLARHQGGTEQNHQTARMSVEALDKMTNISTPSQPDTGLVDEGQIPSTARNTRNVVTEVTGDDTSIYNSKQSNAQDTSDQHVRNIPGSMEEQSSETQAVKQQH